MISNRLKIGQGLVALLTSLALYDYVKLGSVFDPSPYNSFSEVLFHQARSGPAGSGGNLIGWRIEDQPIFKITSGFIYETDSTAAMQNMLTAMDTLMPVLHSRYQITDTSTSQPIASVYSVLENQIERAMPVRFPNGHVYLLWDTYCQVSQQYNVTVTS